MPTPDIIPNDETQTNKLFFYAALADKQEVTLYTDATGAFPEMSLYGKQYFFVAYYYDTNYIFALPIANVQDKTITEEFGRGYIIHRHHWGVPRNVPRRKTILFCGM